MKKLMFAALASLVGATTFASTIKSGESVAFLGDSITAEGYFPMGYIRLCENAFASNGISVAITRAGISGNKSNDMLARLDRDILAKKPTYMTLSCGVNDVWHQDMGAGKGVLLPAYKENITKIVDKAQAAGVKVIILTSTMIGEDAMNPQNKKLIPYNNFLRALAVEKGCKLVDLNTEMQERVAECRASENANLNGNYKTYLTRDGVHMVDKGNKMMAAMILRDGFDFTREELAKAGLKVESQPEEWNEKARREFSDQRFGIFIHWGLYANYAQGEWYLRNGSTQWKPETNGLDEDAYSRMMYGFYPSKFDAKEWVKVFKDAGAKYVTFTSRHHEGFSMWHTKVDDGYNIANSPFKRDITAELAKACQEEGLQFNFYYSLLDWHRKDYPPGTASRSVPLKNRKPDYAAYKKFMLAQIGELIDNYKPGLIWFDGEWDHASHENGKWVLTHNWGMDEIYDFIHSKKVLVANNNHMPIRAKEDIQAFERDLPGENPENGFSANQPLAVGRPLEQCDVLQYEVWGYKVGETKFRPADDVVRMVALNASKGSNLLMNIGPDGSGQLPTQAINIMKEVGAWFKKNGESIYGTDGCPLANEKSVVSTRKGKTIYLHFLDPKKDWIAFNLKDEIVSATYLASGEKVSVGKNWEGKTYIKVDREAYDKFDIVVKLVLK